MSPKMGTVVLPEKGVLQYELCALRHEITSFDRLGRAGAGPRRAFAEAVERTRGGTLSVELVVFAECLPVLCVDVSMPGLPPKPFGVF